MDTFAIDPISITQATPSSVFVPVQAGIGNTNIGRAPQAAGIDFSNASGSTLDSLMKIGQKIVEPQVEIQRKKQALDGAVAALQGQTAADMAKGDIFGGIFGDPTAVAAARQVEKINKVSDSLTEIQKGMDEWKKKTPDEFRAYLPTVMQKHLTGDDMSDALITQAFIQQIPQLVEHHTKASIGYQNQVALNTYGDSIRGVLNAFQTTSEGRRKDPTVVSDDNVKASAVRAFQEIASGIGMLDEKAAGKLAFNITRQMAAEGKFDALELLVNSPITGIMSSEDQARLPKVIEDAKQNYVLHNPKFVPVFQSYAAVESGVLQGLISWQDIPKHVETLRNAGHPDADGKMVQSLTIKAQAAAVRTAKALGNDDAGQLKEFVKGAFVSGYNQRSSGRFTDKELAALVDDRLYPEALKTGTVDKLLDDQMRTGGFLPTAVKTEMSSALNQSAVSGNLMNLSGMGAVRQALTLHSKYPDAMALNFAQDKTALRVLNFMQAHPALLSSDPKVAEEARKSLGPLLARTMARPVPETTTIRSEIAAELPTTWFAGLRPKASWVRDEENAQVARLAETLYRDAGFNAKDAVKVAMSRRMLVDRVAGVPVVGSAGLTSEFRRSVLAGVKGYDKHGTLRVSDDNWSLITERALDRAVVTELPQLNKKDYKILGAMYDPAGNVSVTLDFDGAYPQVTLTTKEVTSEVEAFFKAPTKYKATTNQPSMFQEPGTRTTERSILNITR